MPSQPKSKIYRVVNLSVETRTNLKLIQLFYLTVFIGIIVAYTKYGQKEETSGESSVLRKWLQTTILSEQYPLKEILEEN